MNASRALSQQLQELAQDLDKEEEALSYDPLHRALKAALGVPDDAAVSPSLSPDDVLRLNVGGSPEFLTTRRALTCLPNSALGHVFRHGWEGFLPKDQDGRIFLDLDPVQFRAILDWTLEALRLLEEVKAHCTKENLPPVADNEIELLVPNAHEYQQGQAVWSELITVGSFRFRLMAFPAGTEKNRTGEVAAFVEADDHKELGEGWVIKDMLYQITLVNWKDYTSSICKTDLYSFSKDGIDQGWHNFLRPSEVSCEKGWLGPGETLCFRAACFPKENGQRPKLPENYMVKENPPPLPEILQHEQQCGFQQLCRMLGLPVADAFMALTIKRLFQPERMHAGSRILSLSSWIEIEQLLVRVDRTWLNLKLLYQASRDGWGPAAFHTRCDKQGPTLVVAKSAGGMVFGGCVERSWSSTPGEISLPTLFQPSCFLFRLEAKELVEHKCRGGRCMMTNSSLSLPIFGSEAQPDLVFHSKDGACRAQSALASYGGRQSRGTSLVKSREIDVTELEVFQICEVEQGTDSHLAAQNYFKSIRDTLRSCDLSSTGVASSRQGRRRQRHPVGSAGAVAAGLRLQKGALAAWTGSIAWPGAVSAASCGARRRWQEGAADHLLECARSQAGYAQGHTSELPGLHARHQVRRQVERAGV